MECASFCAMLSAQDITWIRNSRLVCSFANPPLLSSLLVAAQDKVMRAAGVKDNVRRSQGRISGLTQGKPAQRRRKERTTWLLLRLRVVRDPVVVRAGSKATDAESRRVREGGPPLPAAQHPRSAACKPAAPPAEDAGPPSCSGTRGGVQFFPMCAAGGERAAAGVATRSTPTVRTRGPPRPT